jgi:hypothetical protein
MQELVVTLDGKVANACDALGPPNNRVSQRHGIAVQSPPLNKLAYTPMNAGLA